MDHGIWHSTYRLVCGRARPDPLCNVTIMHTRNKLMGLKQGTRHEHTTCGVCGGSFSLSVFRCLS